jgi:hypothetical protein
MEVFMKKFLAVCAIGLALATTNVFADHPSGLGVGVVFGGGIGGGIGGLSLKIPSVPIYWGVSLGFDAYHFGLGVTGDYYIIDQSFAPTLGWYLGVGAFLDVGTWNGGRGPAGRNDGGLFLAAGVRVPIGLEWQPINKLDVFLEIAPGVGIGISPLYFPGWYFAAGLGIRYWF